MVASTTHGGETAPSGVRRRRRGPIAQQHTVTVGIITTHTVPRGAQCWRPPLAMSASRDDGAGHVHRRSHLVPAAGSGVIASVGNHGDLVTPLRNQG
jgi:hypothetical protein